MTTEQTNIDNLQTVQGSQAADIVTLEGRVNQSVKTDASPTFVAVNTGQGANELHAMNQNVRTSDSPTFAGITATGNMVVEGILVAKEYIVSSSVTHMTQSFSSGSTIFGDTVDDTHQFTGSILIGSGSISGSIESTGSFGRVEVSANTLSIGGTEINKVVADNITNLNQPIGTTDNVVFNALTASSGVSGSATSTGSFGTYGNNLIVKASNAADLLSVFDSSDDIVFKVNNNKTLKLSAVTGSQPASEPGGMMYSGSQWFLGTE